MSVTLKAINAKVRRVFRSRITQSVVGVFGLNLASGSDVFADEAGETGKEVVDLATKKMEAAKGAFIDAINGDQEAQIALFTQYLLPVIAAAGAIFVGYIVASTVGRWVGQFVSKQVDETLGRFAGKAIKTLVMMFVLMGVASYFGFDVTSLAAILAAVGFAVGMALSGTIGNFAAGIMLLMFRPFKVGDYVVMAGTEGVVEAIDLFTTELNTLDNRRLIVPNGEVFGATIENATHNEFRRVDVNVGCDYEADLDLTRATLESAIANIPKAVASPAPQAYLMDLGDSSVNWQVRVWCKPVDYWDVRQDLTYATKKGLDAASIGIPYPQMDIHITQDAEEVLQKPRRREAPKMEVTLSRMKTNVA